MGFDRIERLTTAILYFFTVGKKGQREETETEATLSEEEKALLRYLKEYPEGVLFVPSGKMVGNISDTRLTMSLADKGYLESTQLEAGVVGYHVLPKTRTFGNGTVHAPVEMTHRKKTMAAIYLVMSTVRGDQAGGAYDKHWPLEARSQKDSAEARCKELNDKEKEENVDYWVRPIELTDESEASNGDA